MFLSVVDFYGLNKRSFISRKSELGALNSDVLAKVAVSVPRIRLGVTGHRRILVEVLELEFAVDLLVSFLDLCEECEAGKTFLSFSGSSVLKTSVD